MHERRPTPPTTVRAWPESGHLLGAALAPLVLGGSCAPTPYEAGAAVLIAAPVAVGVGLGLVVALAALWRPLKPAALVPLRPALAVAGTALAAGVGALVARSDQDVARWIGIAILTFGPTYLTVLLLAWRVSLAIAPARAATAALLAATVIAIAPALLLLLGAPIDGFIVAWVYGGIYGVPPLVILFGLLLEVLIRRAGRPAVPGR